MKVKIITHPAAAIFLHILIISCLYLILSFFGFIKGMPSNETIQRWDAHWYRSIVSYGYQYSEGHQSNVAFYPLFPWIWKITGFSPLLISLLNYLFTLTGFLILQRTFRFDNKQLLLFLSIPSLFFCYVPYSESIFFLSACLFIYGLRFNSGWLYIGLLLCCLSKSASVLFIPLILFTKLYNITKFSKPHIIKEIMLPILLVIVCQISVKFIQFIQTGEIISTGAVQKQWNREPGWPELPLTTWDHARLIWLDGLALFIGVSAGFVLITLLFRKFKSQRTQVGDPYLFSLGFLCCITLVTLFFSNPEGETSIYSLNRFVFTSPFFFVLLIYHLKSGKRVTLQAALTYIGLFALTSLLLGSVSYINGMNEFDLPILKTKIYFLILSLYSLLYLLIRYKTGWNTLFSGLYLLNTIIQIVLFENFLHDVWIG